MNLLYSTAQLQFLNLVHYPEISLEEGAFSFLCGGSGCGKSTYLKLLNGTTIPNSGDIFYREQNIKNLEKLSYRKKVLLVPQETFLTDGSILDNFNFYYDAREEKRLEPDDMQKYLNICCADFPLSTDCKNLSGGEKQRVFVSIFLSFSCEILLLDEPTSALDEKTSVAMLSSIKQYCKQEHITSLCVCHNELLVNQFSDKTIRLGECYE